MRSRYLRAAGGVLLTLLFFAGCDEIDRDAPTRYYVAPDANEDGSPFVEGGFLPDGAPIVNPPDGSSDAPITSGFNPATLVLTGWWRAPYTASPWVGTESAGPSGGRNLTEATNAPAAGTPLKTLTPAAFDGANDQLSSALTVDAFISPGAFSIVVLFIPEGQVADTTPAEPYLLPGLFVGGSGGTVAVPLLSYSTAGVRAGFHDGTWSSVAGAAAISAWHLARVRFNGTLLELGIDSGAMAPLARAAVSGTAAGTVKVGARHDLGSFFKGQIAELMVSRNVLSDTDFTNVRSYVNARYGLAL